MTGESRTPDEIRDAVYLVRGDVSAKQSRFWLLLVLSACIATTGIVSDSTDGHRRHDHRAARDPEPGHRRRDRLRRGAGTALVRGHLAQRGRRRHRDQRRARGHPRARAGEHNAQIAGRVSPTIVDLVAAATTGLAGAFAAARRDIGDILPGVAIAISLVPPLAVVGVTAVDGVWDGAFGALLLFLTNALAIVVVGTLLGLLRVRHGQARDPAFASRPVYSVVVVTSALVVAGLSLATVRTIQLSNWRDVATRIEPTWASGYDERLVQARFDGSTLGTARRG